MATAAAPSASEDFTRARRAMIDSQLRPSGVNDLTLIDAFMRVAREDYVAADQRAVAYVDRSLPLGEGRALTAPLSQARLLTEAKPKATDKALLIAGGTGYLAAVLAPLVASLDVVESDARLSGSEGSKAGNWHSGALTGGWKKGGPYDLIVIDGAVETVPAALATQLADDGRIVTGTVVRGVTSIAVGRKVDKSVALLPLIEMGLPILTDFAAPKGWSF
ncbi:protein-L-isoaspartate O-methyltransferase family protein [Croceicoccus naphthovorans]|uniref:Protein-L-isoaspartate O-methyltransferase n=1 Tax=Croceicoccus naphthovorans TaxID=1348774 RepID=A0A0G3XKU3_9SPHN|nr:hypothetical protein [Croceicoccus naphthovorans]AKM11221.1 hypothetical protein AB433_16575 [Croceicoccus naphthovorans]MBB3989877.1 protein-L-isoaspartate(D-aspartate) O-methyltransferase [Croceicoccus naphthovorans]